MNCPATSHYVDLRLSHHKDSAAQFKIASALDDLVNGFLRPVYAAEIVDEAIRSDLESCYELYKSEPPPSPKILESGLYRKPNPDAWMRSLWIIVTLLAVRVPADHHGQDAVVSFLKELVQLPRYKVPCVTGHSKQTDRMPLWTIERFQGLLDRMVDVNKANFTTSLLAECNNETVLRYLNFSAFTARLLSEGVVETATMASLIQSTAFTTLPSVTKAGMKEKSYEPNKVYTAATAQWILHAGHTLFRLCEQTPHLGIARYGLSQASWSSWRNNFERTCIDRNISARDRQLSFKALAQMSMIESQAPKTDHVPHVELSIEVAADDWDEKQLLELFCIESNISVDE